MKYLITVLKILGVCALAGIVDDTDRSSMGTPPVDFETYDISSDRRFEVVSCIRRRLDDLDYELCKRNPDVAINKVVDGEVVIWEDSENQFRESSVIYDQDSPVVIRVQERVTLNLNHYRKIEEGWKWISHEEYIAVLKDLRGSVPTKSTFGLNLRFHNENPKYVVEKITKKEANMYIYSPLKGHRIKFIYDNSKSIWKANEPSHNCISVVAYFKGESPHLLHLFIADDNFHVYNIFYKLVRGHWKLVTEANYTESIPELKDNSARSIMAELDLKTYNYRQFDVRSRSYENPYIKYIPKDEYRVTRVSFGGEMIWKSEDPEIFASSVDFFDDGGPHMAKLNFNFQYPFFFKVFIKRAKGWEEGEELDVKDRIYLLQTKRGKVLEIGDVSPDVVSIMPLKMDTVDYLLLASKKDSDVMAIRDGTQELWSYPGLDKYFANGWLYFFPKRPKLLHFRIRDTYLGHEDFYFIWINGVWETMSKHDYAESMNVIVYSSNKGLDHMEVPCSDEAKKSLEKHKSDGKTSDDKISEEKTPEKQPDPGFKEKLYSKYGSPDFDPTDDEETLRLIASLHDEDFYEDAAEVSKSFEYLTFPYDLMTVKSSLDGGKPRRRRAISFSHYDPRGFREPTESYTGPTSPMPPYKSVDTIHSLDDFDEHKLSRSKRHKSTSDISKELELHGYHLFSELKRKQNEMPKFIREPWSSDEATPAPPPTPSQSPMFEQELKSSSSKTPTPPSTKYGSDSSRSSSSLNLPSSPDTPEMPRRRIRRVSPKEEPKKPSKPDFAFIPTISALFLISIFSVIF